VTARASTVDLHGGLTLSVAHAGDESAPLALVLLPGPTDSWRSYRTVIDRLPSSVRVIAVSQRGHGDSDKPLHGYRTEDFASDARALLDVLGVEHAVLVGHSGSCLAARRVAIDHPDRVVGLVLEASPATLQGHPELGKLVTGVLAGLRDPIDARFARSFLVDTSTATLPPEVLDELVAEMQKVPAHVWRETFGALHRYDDVAELHRIAAPALLIWGDGDPLVSHEMQRQLLDRLPGATLITYTGVGHTPRWEDPDRFAADVVTFLDGVSTRERR
jgi:pimeloyl-ACP methyl ester carboxylesterase